MRFIQVGSVFLWQIGDVTFSVVIIATISSLCFNLIHADIAILLSSRNQPDKWVTRRRGKVCGGMIFGGLERRQSAE